LEDGDFTTCFGLLLLGDFLLDGFIDLLLVVVLLSDLLELVFGSASSFAHTFSLACLVILGPLILVPTPSSGGPGSNPFCVPATAPVLSYVSLSCAS
jgi:hypothetical protein